MASTDTARFTSQALALLVNLFPNTNSSPYVKGILSAVGVAIQAINESRVIPTDAEQFIAKILELATTVFKALQAYGDTDDDSFALQAAQLIESLENLARAVSRRRPNSIFKRVITQNSVVKELNTATHDLEHQVALFTLRLQMKSLALSDKQPDQELKTQLEKRIERQHAEELEYLKEKSNEKTFRPPSQRLPNQRLPPPPQVFFGRDDALDQISQLLVYDSQAFACILGPGGIGKTSLAIAAAHHPRVVETYGIYRYFIPCEPFDNSDSLLSAIAQIFRLPRNNPISYLQKIAKTMGSKFLLLLDNFETPWEAESNRIGTEALLAQLCAVPNLSLLVTLRGTEKPQGIPWSKPFLPPLPTLDFEAATHTFIAISDVSEEEEGLSALIHVLDMVPLAVTLMATQAQYQSCASLMQRWEREKTSMITRGYQGRLSSMDVSIQVSLTSERFLQAPEAKHLLQILALLPDGVLVSDLASMNMESFGVLSAVSTLQRVGLSQQDSNGRLRVLSPVREYVNTYMPVTADIFRPIFNYHASLGRQFEQLQFTPGNSLLVEKLTSEIGNVHTVIKFALDHSYSLKEAVQTTIDISDFHMSHTITGSLSALLDAALRVSRQQGFRSLESACLRCKGESWGIMNERKGYCEMALSIARELKDSTSIIRCLRTYSVYCSATSQDQKALELLEEAVSLFTDEIPIRIRARVLSSRCDVLGDCGLLRESARSALSALQLAQAGEMTGFVARCYKNLARSVKRRGLYLKATDYALLCIESLTEDVDVTRGWIAMILSHCYLVQYKLQEADEICRQAYSIWVSLERPDWLADSHHLAASICIARGDTTRALELLQYTLSRWREMQHMPGQREVTAELGMVELCRGNYITAWSHLSEAEKIQRGLRGAPASNILLTKADVLLQSRKPDESISFSVTAGVVSSKKSMRLEVARAIQRIGDAFYTNSPSQDLETAEACYQATLDSIKYLGVPRHVGDCCFRLGMVELQKGSKEGAMHHFKRALKFYQKAEINDEAQLCEDVLKCELESAKEILNELPFLPLATPVGDA